jgi:hypothetical protein
MEKKWIQYFVKSRRKWGNDVRMNVSEICWENA